MKKYPVKFKGKLIEGYYATKCGKFFGPRNPDEPLSIYYPPDHDTNPYPRVAIRGNKGCHNVMAHTFVPYPKPKGRPNGFKDLPEKWQKYILACEEKYNLELQVDHIDTDKFNWKVDNLRWVTAKENQLYYQREQKQLKLAKKITKKSA